MFKRFTKKASSQSTPRAPLPSRSGCGCSDKRTISTLIQTDEGAKRVASVLASWIQEDKDKQLANQRAVCRANAGNKGQGRYKVDGDDLVHPIYGRFVGTAKWMRDNPGREPMVR